MIAGSAAIVAVGINCTPPEHIDSLLQRAAAVTDLPLLVYPNNGRTWDGDTYEWRGTGVDGLRTYIRTRRQADFEDTLCRKLLAFALGRGLLPGDDGTVEAMRAKLAAGGHRFGPLVEVIVTSPQFRYKRVSSDPQPGSGP